MDQERHVPFGGHLLERDSSRSPSARPRPSLHVGAVCVTPAVRLFLTPRGVSEIQTPFTEKVYLQNIKMTKTKNPVLVSSQS